MSAIEETVQTEKQPLRHDFRASFYKWSCTVCQKAVLNRGCKGCSSRFCKACYSDHTCTDHTCTPTSSRQEASEVSDTVEEPSPIEEERNTSAEEPKTTETTGEDNFATVVNQELAGDKVIVEEVAGSGNNLLVVSGRMDEEEAPKVALMEDQAVEADEKLEGDKNDDSLTSRVWTKMRFVSGFAKRSRKEASAASATVEEPSPIEEDLNTSAEEPKTKETPGGDDCPALVNQELAEEKVIVEEVASSGNNLLVVSGGMDEEEAPKVALTEDQAVEADEKPEGDKKDDSLTSRAWNKMRFVSGFAKKKGDASHVTRALQESSPAESMDLDKKSESLTVKQAAQDTPLANKDAPGSYEITCECAVTVEASPDSSEVADLKEGESVNVLEVVHLEKELRIRGRIETPCGWISLENTSTGDRWARKQAANEEKDEVIDDDLVFHSFRMGAEEVPKVKALQGSTLAKVMELDEKSDSSPVTPAAQDTPLANKDAPGSYEITCECTVTKEANPDSSEVGDLKEGESVNVLEVVYLEKELRIRGRIETPCGWISLENTSTGDRWARKQAANEEKDEAGDDVMFYSFR